MQQIRLFYTLWQKPQTLSAVSEIKNFAECFPLPWSSYVRLMSVGDENARKFYESEALCGGWSVRQLNRQISSRFYERTLLSHNKAAMFNKGSIPDKNDITSPGERTNEQQAKKGVGN